MCQLLMSLLVLHKNVTWAGSFLLPWEREIFQANYKQQTLNCDTTFQKPTERVQYGRDSAAGIATHYRPDGLGPCPCGGETFCTHPDWPWGPLSLLYNE